MNSNIGYRDEDGRCATGEEYFCDVCDANCNSIDMWETHLKGKRHLKNMKKTPVVEPPQVKSVVKDLPPLIQPNLDKIEEPIIGLCEICEMNSSKSSCDPTYTCKLCHTNGDKIEIVTHILSTKHRLKYIEKADPDGFKLIESMCLMKCAKDPIVAEKAAEVEQKEGRGKVEVREEVLNQRKRNHNNPEYMEYERAKKNCKEPNPHMPGYRPPQVPADHEFTKRVRFFPIDAKLRMLEELSRPPIATDSEARVVANAVKVLSDCLMQYKIRHLPMDIRARMTREMLSQRTEYIEPWEENETGWGQWDRMNLRGAKFGRNFNQLPGEDFNALQPHEF